MAIDISLPPDKYFHVMGGPSIPTLLALRAYLRSMTAEQYRYHVLGDKNDFASWVRDVFGEDDLASRMRKCHTKESMAELLDAVFMSRHSRASAAPETPASSLHSAAPPPSSLSPSPDDVSKQREHRVDASVTSTTPRSLSDEIPTVRQKPTIIAEVHIDDARGNAVADGASDGEDRLGEWPDEAFTPIRREMSERNERLGEKYDTIIKRFQSAKDDPLPKDLEERSERMVTRYNDLLLKISESRRKGHDMFFPAILAKQFIAKLNLAKATRSVTDFAIADLVLDQTERAIAEAIAQDPLDVKRQVLAMAGMLEDTPAAPQTTGQASGGARK